MLIDNEQDKSKTSNEGLKKKKMIPSNSFIMELNILELPIFQFSYYKGPTKGLEHEEMNYSWKDSNGLDRSFKILSPTRLPRQFEMDVFYALSKLFVYKNAPIEYDEQKNSYIFKNKRLYFSIYEVIKMLGYNTTGGKAINDVKDAIKRLADTDIYSFGNGVFYEKSKEQHVINAERKIKLITEYSFIEKEDKLHEKTEDDNWIEFGSLFFNNLQLEYFRYLDEELYFSLKNGMSKRIYTYLEKNRYDGNRKPLKYVKRKLEVLANKIPIEYKYISELKRKLEPKLEELIKKEYLTDYEITNEFIYFYFGITKEDRHREEERKALGNNTKKTYLRKISNNLVEELVCREVDPKKAEELVRTNTNWCIMKYCLWVDKQLWSRKKIESIGGLLVVAIENKWILSSDNDINEFVEELKREEEETRKQQELDIEGQYRDYLDTNINNFKNENPELYEQFKEQSFATCIKQLYPRLSPEEQEIFNIEKYNYSQVKKALEENLLFYLKLKLFGDFKIMKLNSISDNDKK